MKNLNKYTFGRDPNRGAEARARLAEVRVIQLQYHLRIADWSNPTSMHPEIRKIIGTLYSRKTQTDCMIASIIRAIYSFKQSVFLLSNRTAIDLITGNPEIPNQFKIQLNRKTLERHTFFLVRDRLEELGVWETIHVRDSIPRIYRIVHPIISNDIGTSSPEWVDAILDNINAAGLRHIFSV